MNRIQAVALSAIVLFAAADAHASPLSCAQRLAQIGVDANMLSQDKTFVLDGQSVKVEPGDTGESICKRVDAANLPLTRLTAENVRLQKEKQDAEKARDLYKAKAEDTSWFRRNYILGWLGWPALWSYALLQIGMMLGKSNNNSGSLHSFFK